VLEDKVIIQFHFIYFIKNYNFLEKSQEKSPFRTSCYHQQCTAKSNNTLDNFYDNNSKPIEEMKHFCSYNNDQSHIEYNNVSNNNNNMMKFLANSHETLRRITIFL